MAAPSPSWRDFVTCIDLSQPCCRVADCRKELTGRRRAYCSDRHAREFERNHVWSAARRAARRRANWSCERCGFKPSDVRKDPVRRRLFNRHELRLEVNHIQALGGRYRQVNCLNHQENLEVLCHDCHRLVTGALRLPASGGMTR
jgi:hypothetical protein